MVARKGQTCCAMMLFLYSTLVTVKTQEDRDKCRPDNNPNPKYQTTASVCLEFIDVVSLVPSFKSLPGNLENLSVC